MTYRVYYPVTNFATYLIEIYMFYTSTILVRELEFGEVRATVATVSGIVH